MLAPPEIFVGRKNELARGERAVETALHGEKGAVLLFSGKAGVGKTRLAQVVAQKAAAARGARVVWGRAWEAGGAPSYWPWIQVFRALGAKEDPLDEAATQQTTLLDLQQARFAAFDRAARWLKTEAKDAPLTIVLDDLHAADVSSLLFLHFLVRDLHGSRLFLIGTYRDVEARLAGEVGVILGKVAREGELIELGALSQDDVLAWMREASRDHPHRDHERKHKQITTAEAEQVFRASEGNALFVHELLRLSPSDLDPSGLSMTSIAEAAGSGLRAILDEHFSRVSKETRDILEIASVFGRDLDASSVSAIAKKSPDEVESAFREARDAGLLGFLSGGERLSFTHILLRERLYTNLMPSRRAALHSDAAEHILARGSSSSTNKKSDLVLAAHHLLESSSPSRRVAEVALEAARGSLAKLAFEDASLLCGRALTKQPPPPPLLLAEDDGGEPVDVDEDAHLVIDLELTLAEALMRAGKTAAGRDACVRAAARAKKARSAERQAQAALVFATELNTGHLDTTMIGLLRDAIDVLPDTDSKLRACVLARYAASLVPPASSADLVVAITHADAAVAMAHRIGDPDTLLFALHYASSAKGYMVPAAKRIAMAGELFDLAKSLNRPLVLLNISSWHVVSLREARPLEADAALAEYERLTQDFPQPHYRWRVPMLRATFKELEGDFAGAEAIAREALVIAEAGEVRMGTAAWAMQRISMAQLSGDPSLATAHADLIFSNLQSRFGAAPFIAWLHAALGAHEEARRMLAMCVPISIEPSPPSVEVPGPLPWVLLTGEAVTQLGDLGDREWAEQLYPALCLHAPLNALFWGPLGCGVFGPTQRIAGDLAQLIGRTDEARRWYEEAIPLADKLNAPAFRMLAERRLANLDKTATVPTTSASAPPARAPAAPLSKRRGVKSITHVELQRQGEMWRISSGDGRDTFHLKDSKGLQYLADLIARPGHELHVTQLSELVETPGDAGFVLDDRSKNEYKARVEALRDQLEEARRFSDGARTTKLEAEIEAIADQLAAAVGLGGRDRKVGSHVERLRINVQRRLRDAIQRIEEHDPALGRYLTATIKTGVYCIFSPV